MNKPAMLPLCIFVTLWACASPAVAQLELDAPQLPAGYYAAQLDEIETQIADRLAQLGVASNTDRVVLTAQKNLRMVARELLIAGRDAGEDGAVATMTSLMLVEAAGKFDALIGALPQDVAKAIGEGAEGRKKLERYSRTVDALRRFNEVVGESNDTLKSAAAADVDRYTQKLLSPLATVVTELGAGRPQPTWVASGAELGTGAGRPVNQRDLSELSERVRASSLSDAASDKLEFYVTMMRRGRHLPRLQPYVARFYQHVTELLDLAEVFDDADWLADDSRAALMQQVQTAVMLLEDPTTRSSAVARIDRLGRFQLATWEIDAAAKRGADIDPLRELFMTAYRLSAVEQTRPTSDQLILMIERVAAAAGTQRSLGTTRLPPDIKRVQQITLRQYAAVETALFDSLPLLAESPEQVTLPRWTEPVKQLEALSLLALRLDQIPRWVERMKRFNPPASRGLYQQLAQIANDLLNEATFAGASAALAELDEQLLLFEQLPHEPAITGGEAGSKALTGEHHPLIIEQLALLRSQWAAAWSAGADPTPYGRKLMLMRRLFEHIHHATGLVRPAEPLRRLNRWAGWEIRPDAIEPMIAQLPAQVRIASAQAGAGDYEALAATLGAIDRQVPVAQLTATFADLVGQPLAKHPEGLAGTLGQVLFAPPDDAFGALQRLELAQLSVLLNAAHEAQQAGQAQQAAQLRDAVGDLARRLLRQLDPLKGPAAQPANKPLGAIDV